MLKQVLSRLISNGFVIPEHAGISYLYTEFNYMRFFKKFLLLIALIAFFSCKNYTIPVNSFKKQIVDANAKNLKNRKVNNPLLGFNNNIKYYSNNVNGLYVFDKSGSEYYLSNSPSIEMRVTLNNGKRRVFYFDTVFIENDMLKGSQSRFINKTRGIHLDSIKKIELQDGGKKFKYQN